MDFTPPSFPGAPASFPPAEPPKPSRGRRRGKSDAAEETVTKKVVDRQRRFAIIFALAIALVAGVVVLGGTAPTTHVVRAKVDVAAGTLIDPAVHLETVAVPDEYIQPGALTGKSPEAAMKLAVEDLAGVRAQYPLSAKQQIHPDLFNVEMTLSSPLQPNERLMSISANVGNALAGQIKPGDRVDIAASTGDLSGVILNDIEVVSVTVSESQYQALASQQTGEKKDSRAEELLPGAPIPGIYVVRVTAEDAPALFAASAGSDLTLIYRGPEARPLEEGPVTATSVICADRVDVPGCEG